MKDTNLEVYQKQFEIIAQKSILERFEMIEQIQTTMRQLAEQRIRQTYPHINSSNLTAEIFKIYYADEFSLVEQAKIMESIRHYHIQKQINIV